jgi:hypothetical protein
MVATCCLLGGQLCLLNGESWWRHAVSWAVSCVCWTENHGGDMLSLGLSAAFVERRIMVETCCLLGGQLRLLNGESWWRHAVSWAVSCVCWTEDHGGDMLSLGLSAMFVERRIMVETCCLLAGHLRLLNGKSHRRHAVSWAVSSVCWTDTHVGDMLSPYTVSFLTSILLLVMEHLSNCCLLAAEYWRG